jgi:hypothetical protein
MPSAGPRAWFDLCLGGHDHEVNSECPGNTYCENIDDGNDKSIKCVNRQSPGTSAERDTYNAAIIGSSGTVKALSGRLNAQPHHTVIIPDNMKASVAAFVLSEFLVQITRFC